MIAAHRFLGATVGVLVLAVWSGIAVAQQSQASSTAVNELPATSLATEASALFPIGVGISDRIDEHPQDWPLLTSQFRMVTPENCMKPQSLQRQPGQFNFAQADRFVKFASAKDLKIVGHCLVWAKDDRTDAWYFKVDGRDITKDELLQRMRGDIEKTVSRYRGQIAMWDVVNEALADGDGYLRQAGWSSRCGEEFIAEAFRAAHQADPDALLIYNDYNNELPDKREKMLRLIRSLQQQNVPLHAIGLQGHYELNQIPLEELEKTILAVKELGLKVVISELDIDVIPRGRWWADNGAHREELAKVDPYVDGVPDEIQQQLAKDYASLFRLFVKHADSIARVSFWNLYDDESWLNDFPWKRVNHPLLFDRNRQPKPAYQAVIDALRAAQRSE